MKQIYINYLFVIGIIFGAANGSIYGDFRKMISGIEYLGIGNDSNKVNVQFNGDLIASADWKSDQGLYHNQIYIYSGYNLIFIEEYIEESLSKHIYFIASDKSDEYFSHVYGKSFNSTDDHITEVFYEKNKLPVSYEFSSINNQKIGSIDLTYDSKDHLVREVWYHGKNKIREFENRFDPTRGSYDIIERDGNGNIIRMESIK